MAQKQKNTTAEFHNSATDSSDNEQDSLTEPSIPLRMIAGFLEDVLTKTWGLTEGWVSGVYDSRNKHHGLAIGYEGEETLDKDGKINDFLDSVEDVCAALKEQADLEINFDEDSATIMAPSLRDLLEVLYALSSTRGLNWDSPAPSVANTVALDDTLREAAETALRGDQGGDILMGLSSPAAGFPGRDDMLAAVVACTQGGKNKAPLPRFTLDELERAIACHPEEGGFFPSNRPQPFWLH